MTVALRVRFFELESVLCVEPTPVGSTVDCELLQGKSHVLFFASAFNSLANMRPQKKKIVKRIIVVKNIEKLEASDIASLMASQQVKPRIIK